MDTEQQFLAASVVLPTRSAVDTAKFYREKLGFSVELLWREPPYAVVVRGNAVIEFGEGRGDGAGGGTCYVHVNDVDAVYAEYAAAGLEFVEDCADRDYGCRDFRVRDNNGNVLIVGSPLLGRDPVRTAVDRRASR